jgi:large subunit ribosomal protein L25
MAKFKLKALTRTKMGSRATKLIRESGYLPGNIYGHKKENRLVQFPTKEIVGFIQAGHRFLTVEIDGVEENGMLKEVQYASNGFDPIHIDIARIDIHEKITAAVRVETMGTPKGIAAGGNLDLTKREVAVEGPASAIPDKIVVTIEALEIGQSIRVKDLPAVPECRYADDPEQVVVAVLQKRLEEEAPAGIAAVGPAEPEVIGKKPSEEAEAEEGAKGEPESKKKESKE